MDDTTLGQLYSGQSSEPVSKSNNPEKAPFDKLFLEEVENTIDNIERLKRMESIDSHAALVKVKKRVGRNVNIYLFEFVRKLAVVMLLPLLAFSFLMTHKYFTSDQIVLNNELIVPATIRSYFILPDSTKVWLNSETSLIYPTRFTGKERMVELKGEAYFEVAHNASKPFIVKCENMLVEAVGTSFNVSAYSEDPAIEVVLSEGKINILEGLFKKGSQKILSLEPGQMASYDKKSSRLSLVSTDIRKYSAWREGKLMFRNDHLGEVLSRIERWYNVEFVLSRDIDYDYTFTGTFEGEELMQLLHYIELTTPVQFSTKAGDSNTLTSTMKRSIEIKPKSSK